MHCLLCDDYIAEEASWYSFFIRPHDRYICNLCERKLSYITGEFCHGCGRPLSSLDPAYRYGEICRDCMKWKEENCFPFIKNRSTYVYNDGMKEILARFKFRGDAELVKVFQIGFVSTFQKYFSNAQFLIPVPLSKEREYERGFNQAERLAACLPIPILPTSLTRKETEKQSKKGRIERIAAANPFYFQEEECLTGQHLVIIDDVYTTGITVRQVGELLYHAGAQSVSSLTLCRG
ncbi:ComF family protein [Bacillus cytotoxicus]|uniref:ComF family protein n=1 Tax=Bacillus cereus group TaxID=86661 RepID=UPI00066125EE|nr:MULTISPECIES: ComF family protein [Bacillus cereus group]AWC34548.1 amidophosphoribosyltransferase [Bacillus cytotoxicus]AWC38545.1 amidophosphoribosyltransferase [Bacillus cytotoxicus]AWC46523.1 amidophosphoribosyltransferase [Bacillus cytotoxicus]AWC62763.1 amidophosphoribosyltransferase [Bacillus cytotoxicus]KMT49568.1 competence protein ComF [Bacillus cytotoxicus]